MARLRAGHARPLRNMVMWDVGRPAPRPPGRCAAAESSGGVKTPPYDVKDKCVATARLRAGRARPLRNMVMWDVGRSAPRPPGRLAAMRSLTDRRCRGRRPRRPAEVSAGRRRRGQAPSLRCKNKWVATARLRAGHARPLRNMVMWDVGRPAPGRRGGLRQCEALRIAAVGGGVLDTPRRLAAAEGSGGVKTPPYNVKDKRVATARLRAGRARPLRNMIKWDVGRPAPRPPGRLAAMRSLTDRRCRGRRPRRPAEVSGGGRRRRGQDPSLRCKR